LFVVAAAVVVVVVVMTSPSGNANIGEQMLQTDEKFPTVLVVNESGVSVSPSRGLTAILLARGHHLTASVVAHS